MIKTMTKIGDCSEMNNNMKTCITVISILFTLILSAEQLRFEGVIGNSGELKRPVQFGAILKDTRGLGAAYDSNRGILYDRAGRGVLNAYALDGRLVAQYKLPPGEDSSDAMTLCGKHLVFLLKRELYKLSLDSADGASVEKIKCSITDPEGLSSSSHNNQVTVRTKTGELYLLNPSEGSIEPFGKSPEGRCSGMDWDGSGAFVLVYGKVAQRMENSKLIENGKWPKRFAGNRESGIDCATYIDGYWYGSAWHGTIKRFTSDFEPAPGVVLGGASGHFIGHVACNYDVELAQGISLISPGLFAIGGMYGIIHLAHWQPENNRMKLLRRIGAQAPAGGLALDSQGRILTDHNIWKWSDDALAPADVSHVFKIISPSVNLDPDTIIGIASSYGKPSLAIGSFHEEKMNCRRLDNFEIPKNIVGVALYHEQPDNKGALRFLILGADGSAKLHEVAKDPHGPWRKYLGEVQLKAKTPVKNFTSLVMPDPETLLVAGDGTLISFKRDGLNWKESNRWNDSFGPGLKLAICENHLALSDPQNNRIAIYSFKERKLLTQSKVDSPSDIAINGSFVVVYESAAQQILKLRIVE